MKINDWSKTTVWLIGLAVAAGCLLAVSTAYAQFKSATLVIRQGEERVLENGIKIVVHEAEGGEVRLTVSGVTPAPPPSAPSKPGRRIKEPWEYQEPQGKHKDKPQ
jgi:hypothetical protein